VDDAEQKQGDRSGCSIRRAQPLRRGAFARGGDEGREQAEDDGEAQDEKDEGDEEEADEAPEVEAAVAEERPERCPALPVEEPSDDAAVEEDVEDKIEDGGGGEAAEKAGRPPDA
jgi:hypothetical protein